MIDFISGLAIGLVAAAALWGAWLLRSGYGDPPWVILTGSACGYVGGIVGGFLVFCYLLSAAFKTFN